MFVALWRRVSAPFWLLDAKRANSALDTLCHEGSDPIPPTVQNLFAESSLSAEHHSTRRGGRVGKPLLSCDVSEVTEPISRFRMLPAFRTQDRATLRGRCSDIEQRFSGNGSPTSGGLIT